MLLSNVCMNLYSIREHAHEEMLLHAKNTATAIHDLATEEESTAVMAARIGVWFDSNYFQRMTYRNLQGDVLVQRNQELDTAEVPAWFVSLLTLPEARYGTDVLVGDRPIGSLEISIQPTIAYQNLWSVFCEQLLLFVFFGGLVFWLSGMALNVLLKPLKRVEEQAAALPHDTVSQTLCESVSRR